MPNEKKGLRFTFTIPEASRLKDTDPKSVTLVPLTLQQDIEAGRLMEKSQNPFDRIKMSIAAFDGKPVDWVGGGLDAQLEDCSPTVRELVALAFAKVHAPAGKDREDFLASMVTEV